MNDQKLFQRGMTPGDRDNKPGKRLVVEDARLKLLVYIPFTCDTHREERTRCRRRRPFFFLGETHNIPESGRPVLLVLLCWFITKGFTRLILFPL